MSYVRRAWQLWLFAALLILGVTPVALAHEVRPALLHLKETSAGQFSVLWKQPTLDDRRLPIDPVFPSHCEAGKHAPPELLPGVLIDRFTLNCGEAGLDGFSVSVPGLSRTMTDVLLLVQWQDGVSLQHLLNGASTGAEVGKQAARQQTPALPGYFVLGVEHLLFGFDHVLFVLALLFLVQGTRRLIITITAFTVAHSLTLALATFDLVHVSQAPVEAVIALSIVFLAYELTRRPDAPSLTRAQPWLIAAAFGLLHGLGFAGALRDIGLPPDLAAWALLLFNLGVEAGQLLIVATAVALTWLFIRRWQALPSWLQGLPVFALGTLSAYWFIGRAVQLL